MPEAVPLRLLLCSSEPRESACSILRLVAPLQRDPDIELRWHDEGPAKELLRWADAVIIQRNFPTSSLRKRRLLSLVYASGLPLLYETDDNFLETPRSNPHHSDSLKGRRFLRKALRKCDAIIVSTEELARELGGDKPFVVAPNLLDEGLWRRLPVPDSPEPVCIGFAGSPTHAEDLALCEDALERIARDFGDRVRFLFLGCHTARLAALPNAACEPFITDYEAYSRRLQASGIHIGLAPLLDNSFNRAKSAIKWMELSACGIVGVYSDLEPYRKAVSQGRNGLLVGDSGESWYQAIVRLIEERDLRVSMARAAQADLYASHTLSSRAGELPRSIRSLVARVRPRDGAGARFFRWLSGWAI